MPQPLDASATAEAERLPPLEQPPAAAPRLLTIVWPAFLMAGVLEALVFAFFDPHQMAWLGAEPLHWPVQAVYTVAFFVFWAAIVAAGLITQVLQATESTAP